MGFAATWSSHAALRQIRGWILAPGGAVAAIARMKQCKVRIEWREAGGAKNSNHWVSRWQGGESDAISIAGKSGIREWAKGVRELT